MTASAASSRSTRNLDRRDLSAVAGRPTIVFLISILDSFGERDHAIRFAADLTPAFEPLFLVRHPLKGHVPGSFQVQTYESTAEAVRLLERIAPGLLVCCEYFNLPPDLQSAVAASPWRLATMDGTGMGRRINCNPFLAPKAKRSFTVPRRMVHLRPCPVSDPEPDTSQVFHWPLARPEPPCNPALVRRRWRVPDASRIAMIAFAPWALRAAAALGLMEHYERVLEVIAAALNAAGEAVTLFVVSSLGGRSRRQGTVTIREVGYLATTLYSSLLRSCDLVLSDNIIQASVANAFVSGVPTLVLVNSRPAAAPVYNIFPLKLRFPTGSAYYRALEPIELFDRAAIARRVAESWAGRDSRRRSRYLQAMRRLRSPSAILTEIGVD
jgi:Family of unknown function (DUF6365)